MPRQELDFPIEDIEGGTRHFRLTLVDGVQGHLQFPAQRRLNRLFELEAIDSCFQVTDLRRRSIDRDREALTDRAISIIAVADRAGHCRRADSEGAAGGRGAVDRRQGTILVYDGWLSIGDDRALRAGGIGRDIHRHVSQRQVIICDYNHLEAARRGIWRIRCVAGAAVDRRGANRKGAAGGRGTADRRRCGCIIWLTGRSRIGDGRALRTSSVDGEGTGWQIEFRSLEFESADVTGWPLRPSDAALVSRRAGTGRNLIDGRAAVKQSQRLGRAAIGGQGGGQFGIGVLLVSAGRKAATAIARTDCSPDP